MVVAGNWRMCMGSQGFMGAESLLGKMNRSWRRVVVMVARHCECT